MFVVEISVKPKSDKSKAFADAWARAQSLADALADLVVEGNREGLQRGTDADGEDMEPISPNTVRPGDGPPLIPREESSRLIRNFRVRTKILKSRIRLECYWVRTPFVKYHETGTKNMPRRNPSGLRPGTMRSVRGAISRHFGRTATTQIQVDVRSR